MLKRVRLFLIPVAVLTIMGCNSGSETNDTGEYTRKISDTANVAAVMQGFDAKDTAVIGAYLDDRSTITINDIDPKDTSYSTRTKVLYRTGPDGKALAVVYGFKTQGKGIAVMQKVGEKPVVLKEGDKEGDVTNYTDGKVTLQKSGTFVFLNGVQYEEIR